MLSLGDARQLLRQTRQKQDKKDSIATPTTSYFWSKCSTSDPSSYVGQVHLYRIESPHGLMTPRTLHVSHWTGLLHWSP